MRARRIFIFLSLGIGFLLLSGTAAFLWLASALSPREGEMHIAGLESRVSIYRDAHGVPHIFAERLNDAYAALGYLHAENRLFQMEMTRRAGEGRLAEVLGADLLPFDKKMRGLGVAAAARASFAILSKEAKASLASYASGVNAYLKTHHRALPPEFLLLGFTPEPWQESDGMIWAKLMAWQLSSNLEEEIFRARLLAQGFGRAAVERLYAPTDREVPLTTQPFVWLEKQKTERNNEPQAIESAAALRGGAPAKAITRFFDRLPHQASNAFVITGARTASGKPILVNDPHLQLQAPALWYLARIVTPELEIKGASAPGLPLFPLGQNGHVAWGFTTNAIDVEDIVFVPEEGKAIDTRREIFHVKGGADEVFALRRYAGKPILSDMMPEVAAITPAGHVAVLVTTLFDADRTAQAILDINQARKMDGIKAAIKNYRVPPQNLMAADASGAIAYFAVGAIPQRKTGDGFLPLTAANANIWAGVQPVEDNPQLLNPPALAIMNGNNALVDAANCPPRFCQLGKVWAEPYRAMRLEELLHEARGLDAAAAFNVVLDTRSDAAHRLLPRLLAQTKSAKWAGVLDALATWDGRMLADRPEPLIYNVWVNRLLRHFYAEGAESESFWPRNWTLEKRLTTGSDPMVEQLFDETLDELAARFGPDWKRWRWGALHVAPLAHPVWSRVPLVKDLTALAVETDGDATTLQRAAPGSYAGDESFRDEHGAGYRAAYDLADPSLSRFVIATGQSGIIFSPHYGDMVQLWAVGGSVFLSGDAAAFAQARRPLLVLAP
jgi:penicillin amidase